MTENTEARRVRDILATVKPLAAEYYQLTDKPLGVTGEVAEYVAAELLGLELAPPRTKGYDAVRQTTAGPVRVQIKGRAYGEKRTGANASARSSEMPTATLCCSCCWII